MLLFTVVSIGLVLVAVGITASISNLAWQMARGTPMAEVRGLFSGMFGWVLTIVLVALIGIVFWQSAL